MPSRERLSEFIDRVVSGDHVGAIADFYHADASMRENLKPPRVGRDVLMEGERKALARSSRIGLLTSRSTAIPSSFAGCLISQTTTPSHAG